MKFTIEDILRNIDPNATYSLKNDPEWIKFNSIGIDEWNSQTPKPSYQDCLDRGESMVDDGVYDDFEISMSKFLGLTTTKVFGKILDSADNKPSILLYGIVALVAVLVVLYKPNITTVTMAKNAWNRFIITAKQQRVLTKITDEDIVEFNATIDYLSLPKWLKLA